MHLLTYLFKIIWVKFFLFSEVQGHYPAFQFSCYDYMYIGLTAKSNDMSCYVKIKGLQLQSVIRLLCASLVTVVRAPVYLAYTEMLKCLFLYRYIIRNDCVRPLQTEHHYWRDIFNVLKSEMIESQSTELNPFPFTTPEDALMCSVILCILKHQQPNSYVSLKSLLTLCHL